MTQSIQFTPKTQSTQSKQLTQEQLCVSARRRGGRSEGPAEMCFRATQSRGFSGRAFQAENSFSIIFMSDSQAEYPAFLAEFRAEIEGEQSARQKDGWKGTCSVKSWRNLRRPQLAELAADRDDFVQEIGNFNKHAWSVSEPEKRWVHLHW